MGEHKPVPYLATDEDGTDWFGREGVSRLRVMRELAGLTGVRWWNSKARKVWMRPAALPHDCPVDSALHPQPLDLNRDLPDDCMCRQMDEEQWMLLCGRDNASAVPAWEVETRYGLLPWRLRKRLRKLHPALRRGTVLWGGRVTRRAHIGDKILMGSYIVNVPGDTQQQLGRGAMLWCDDCGMQTLHTVLGNGHTMCDSTLHYDRLTARRFT